MIHDVNTYASSVCVRMCLDRLLDPVMAALHMSHLYGRSRACVLMCVDKLPETVNAA